MKSRLITLFLVVLLCSCKSGSSSIPNTHSQSLADPSIVQIQGTGWTSSGLGGTMSKPSSCHYSTSNGYTLPDPTCTPGAIDTTVTQANIFSTICRRGGYTSSVRPPVSLTEPAKYLSMSAYGTSQSATKLEFDHLVPLGLGGASSLQNLWPQPDEGTPATFDPQDPYGINAKDGVEDRLHSAVCSDEVTLSAAQNAIATNWTIAESILGITP
ncbi:MAG: hypothetical protein HKL80_06800 [Acidimicrobiales bacterium]|nr:hypothetical protein [Acidimicrobiales bacterium]